MIRRTYRRPPARRGAVLLVVLGLLALFAVVGLSFVLYAESEATGARNNRAARNELSAPDPTDAANGFLSQLLFGTTDANSAMLGHDLARSRFGPVGGQSPYTGAPQAAGAFNATLDQTQVVNYSAPGAPNPNGWNKAVPWTYPDRNNFYLAYYDQATDTVTVPSFFRPDLFGSLDSTNPNWTNADGRYLLLRPRPQEHPSFPRVPANADGSVTGDVANLKFLTGSQRNDSLWMDPNLPKKTWRGKQYKMLVAPLILDLSGRINLAVAGNNKGIGGVHGSHHGWGQWEQNPTGLLNWPTNNTNNTTDVGAVSQLQSLLNLRYNAANPPAGLNRFTGNSLGVLNRRVLAPQYSLFDASGTGSGMTDAMTLPAPNGFSPFPAYPAGRFAQNQAGLTAQLGAVHGQSFNPLQWARLQNPTAAANNGKGYVPSLEDQLRLVLRSGGPKGPNGYSTTANPVSPNNKLATLFSVSQRWGEIRVPVDNNFPTNFARLASIDLARFLPDYRTSFAGPLSPQNVGNAVQAREGRQNLARDIFVRLAAARGLIDGTNAAYDPTTGYLRAYNAMAGTYGPLAAPAVGNNTALLQQLAQYAANMVDQIDSDDISTSFVWNPADPTQSDVNDTGVVANQPNFAVATIGNSTVFGVELPKLVLNEAACALENDRSDPQMMKAMANMQKRFWIELHNPLSADPTLPDSGAARLRYEQNVTAGFTDPTYAVYQIEIAEVPAPAMGMPPAQPYTDYLKNINPLGYLNNDPVANPVPGMTHKIVLNTYDSWNAVAMPDAPMMNAANDALNVVQPVSPAVAMTANGYYLIGPRDQFPGATNTLNVQDQLTPAVAGQPVNSLAHDAGSNDLTVNTVAGTSNVILLRRLVNPYLPAQTNPAAANYNPYMTVDYLENVPTRDRALYDVNAMRMPPGRNSPSVGRRHPFAAAPCYLATLPVGSVAAVEDQADPAIMGNPPHTFLAKNSNLDNAAGLAWLAHLDREPVNQLELLHTAAYSPAGLTQRFFTGTGYQGHLSPAASGTDPTFPNFAQALDLLAVSSRLPGVPLGGREPGKVNLNAAGDVAILNAVLDPQSGNTFNAAFVSGAWPQLLASRTVNATTVPAGTNNLPSATAFEVTGAGPTYGTDRPFAPNTAVPNSAFFTDTLFRQGTTPGYPALFNNLGGNHSYLQSEPLRKGWNNLTTVSDGFLVVFTVGFFEVNGTNQLGAELFDKVPGDLRAQYAGIVDRSALTIEPPPASTPTQLALGAQPWETKLSADAGLGDDRFQIVATPGPNPEQFTVYSDGTPVVVTAGRPLGSPGAAAADTGPLLYIGYSGIGTGGDGEWVRVDQINPQPPAFGLVTVRINTTPANPALPAYSTSLQRFHGGGSRVSNAVVGHPGPQPLFDYRDTTGKYKGVLPYFMKMVP